MKHYIIIKLSKDEDKEKLIKDIKEHYNNAISIEGVKRVDVFTSSSKLRNRFDMMIKLDLNKQGLQNYEESNFLKEFKDKYDKYISKKTIFDC